MAYDIEDQVVLEITDRVKGELFGKRASGLEGLVSFVPLDKEAGVYQIKKDEEDLGFARISYEGDSALVLLSFQTSLARRFNLRSRPERVNYISLQRDFSYDKV